jgi:hypothetical protein
MMVSLVKLSYPQISPSTRSLAYNFDGFENLTLNLTNLNGLKVKEIKKWFNY